MLHTSCESPVIVSIPISIFKNNDKPDNSEERSFSPTKTLDIEKMRKDIDLIYAERLDKLTRPLN